MRSGVASLLACKLTPNRLCDRNLKILTILKAIRPEFYSNFSPLISSIVRFPTSRQHETEKMANWSPNSPDSVSASRFKTVQKLRIAESDFSNCQPSPWKVAKLFLRICFLSKQSGGPLIHIVHRRSAALRTVRVDSTLSIWSGVIEFAFSALSWPSHRCITVSSHK